MSQDIPREQQQPAYPPSDATAVPPEPFNVHTIPSRTIDGTHHYT